MYKLLQNVAYNNLIAYYSAMHMNFVLNSIK